MKSMQFKKWLVALDKSEMDERLIGYARFWSVLFGAEEIIFVHIRKEEEAWDYIDNTLFTKLINEERKQDEIWKQSIQEEILDFHIPTKVVIGHGSSFDKIFEYCADWDIDLVMAGKKQSIQSKGTMTEDFSKKLPTSFFYIPETAVNRCEKVMIPTDFSEYTDLALLFAKELTEADPNIEILPAHIYKVPTGYHYIGMEFDRFEEDILKSAEIHLKKQLLKVDLKTNDNLFRRRGYRSVAEHLQLLAQENQADLIVVGAKGATPAAYALLGSTAAQMQSYMGRSPLLILKKKGETFDLFNAIINILDPEVN